MPTNELVVVHAKHRIHVITTPAGGARLYVDDELIDTTNDLEACEDEATLVGVCGDNEMVVEAFVKPSQTSARVNGEWVTGEQAYAAAD